MSPNPNQTERGMSPIAVDLNDTSAGGCLLVAFRSFPAQPVVGDRVQLCEPEDGLLHVDAVVERLYERRAAVKPDWGTALWDDDA
jgi:hypothetical protein